MIKDPEAEEVAGHLAVCDDCNRLYSALREVESAIGQSFRDALQTASCPEDWEVASVIKGEASQMERDRISGHTRECDFCTGRAALYYKALNVTEEVTVPEAWREKAVNLLAAGTKSKGERVSIKDRAASIIDWINSSLTPLPGYAAAAAAILIMLFAVIPDKGRIVTVSSTERITVRDSEIPSSFGFMGAGESDEISGMSITRKGGRIVFRWKPVNGAVGDEFQLSDRSAEKTVYKSKPGGEPGVYINRELLERNRLYTWMIKGRTSDGRYFEYSGDFLLTK